MSGETLGRRAFLGCFAAGAAVLAVGPSLAWTFRPARPPRLIGWPGPHYECRTPGCSLAHLYDSRGRDTAPPCPLCGAPLTAAPLAGDHPGDAP